MLIGIGLLLAHGVLIAGVAYTFIKVKASVK